MKEKVLLSFVSLFMLITGCATVKHKPYTYFSEEILELPKNKKDVCSLKDVVVRVSKVIGVRASNIKSSFEGCGANVKYFEDKNPLRPIIVFRNFYVGSLKGNIFSVSCGKEALAEISGREPGLYEKFGIESLAGYKACIYPYKGGYRIYIIGIYPVEGDKIFKKENINYWWNELVRKSKKEFKNARLIKIIYPTGINKIDIERIKP